MPLNCGPFIITLLTHQLIAHSVGWYSSSLSFFDNQHRKWNELASYFSPLFWSVMCLPCEQAFSCFQRIRRANTLESSDRSGVCTKKSHSNVSAIVPRCLSTGEVIFKSKFTRKCLPLRKERGRGGWWGHFNFARRLTYTTEEPLARRRRAARHYNTLSSRMSETCMGIKQSNRTTIECQKVAVFYQLISWIQNCRINIEKKYLIRILQQPFEL